MKKINDLKRIISFLDTLYEEGETCIHPDTKEIVTDKEYDLLRNELAGLLKEGFSDPFFNTPTNSNLKSNAKKIIHDPPMTSISKASHQVRELQEGMLFKWFSDTSHVTTNDSFYFLDEKTIDGTIHKKRIYREKIVAYPKNYYAQSFKLDGVALALYYKKGNLVSAGLRPRDGINGEDVTEQVKYVANVPLTLNEPVTCSIRGEVICKLSYFSKVQKELEKEGEKLRANPRNHAAGGIRQFKEPSKVKKMRLTFEAYNIENLSHPPYKTEIERAKWCNKVLGIRHVRINPFNFYDLDKMEKMISELDYEVDGVVISVNDIEEQEQYGRTGDPKTGNPKAKIAWKFAEQVEDVVIKKIEYNTGRTGSITPVAIFDATRLDGTDVTRASLHNFGFMKRKRIDVGTKVLIIKAGKIIPKVIDVVLNDQEPDYIKECPSCGGKTKLKHTKSKNIDDEKWDILCTNANCPAQNIGKFCHYLNTFGVLGLGESRVEQLLAGGKIHSFADLYSLSLEDCIQCGLTKRQSILALASIHMVDAPSSTDDDDLLKIVLKAQNKKKTIPLWKLFASLGIEASGKSAGKTLVDHFGSLKAILNASVNDLENVGDIGSISANAIKNYFDENRKEIEALTTFLEIELPKTGCLSNLNFVLTGSFSEGKKYWEKEIEDKGGKISSSVSKKTNYLIVGEDAGSKLERAEQLGVEQISTVELNKIINEKLG